MGMRGGPAALVCLTALGGAGRWLRSIAPGVSGPLARPGGAMDRGIGRLINDGLLLDDQDRLHA